MTQPPSLPERGWLSFIFGAEVYAAVSIAIFLPIILEQMAREVGYLQPEFTEPCSASHESCSVHILGHWIGTASFSLYTKSVAVAFQAISVVSFGVLADDGYWRKRLLVSLAILGSASAILFLLPFAPSGFALLLAATLTVVGGTCYAVATVCNNAYIPFLARLSPDVQISAQEEQESETTELLPDTFISPDNLDATALPPCSQSAIALSLATSRISSKGTALGFGSGVVLLTVLMLPVMALDSTTGSLRLAIGISGIWWLVFTLPAARWLPASPKKTDAAWVDVTIAWKRLGAMVKVEEMKRLKSTYGFLLAWIFLSDGFHTTTTTSIIFAKATLHMPSSNVIILGILVQFLAIFSAIMMPSLQAQMGWTNLGTLVRLVVAGCLIPGYASLGVLLGSSRWGLVTPGEMYAASVWFGLLYGPFNSYSRALYAEIIPPGHEARFFSLFAVTDKSASFLGPFVVGLIADQSGSIRNAFFFLLAMLVIPLPILIFGVDVNQGRVQARQYATEECAAKHAIEEVTTID